MKRLILCLLLLSLGLAAGCGGNPPVSTAPLTDEQKQKIKEEDKRVEDEEKAGSGSAVTTKKR